PRAFWMQLPFPTRRSSDLGSSITRGGTQPLVSFFGAMKEQRTFGLESAQLFGIAKPTPGVDFRRRRAVNHALVRNVLESRVTEHSAPLFSRKKLRRYREETDRKSVV